MTRKRFKELNELAKDLIGDDYIEVSPGHLKKKEVEKGEQFGYQKQK